MSATGQERYDVSSTKRLSNVIFMPCYRSWPVGVIALDVVVLWALCSQIAGERV